jgi:hypothetical protein
MRLTTLLLPSYLVLAGLVGCHQAPITEDTPPPIPEPYEYIAPSPTPVPTPLPSPTPTATPTPQPSATPTPTATPSPSPSPSPTPRIVTKTAIRSALVAKAIEQIGVTDGGNNRGKRVDAYNKSVPVALGSPWCASVLTWISLEVGKDLGIPSPYPRTARAIVVGKQFPLKGRKVKPGDTFYIGTYSHTGMIELDGDKSITTLEGNTSPGGGSVEQQRNGEVFTRKKRLRASVLYAADWVD